MTDMRDFLPLMRMIEQEQNVTLQPGYRQDEGTAISLREQEIVRCNGKFVQMGVKLSGQACRLTWLYLKHPQRGTGARIFRWLIEYCRAQGMERFEIWSVHEENIAMRRLCEQFGLSAAQEQGVYANYSLCFKDVPN